MKDILQEFVEKYDLIQRTWDAFWKTYDSYISEQPEESAALGFIDRNSIKAVSDCVFFKSYMQEERSEITVRIEMFGNDGKGVGYFDNVFDEAGNDFDFFFVID